MRLRPQEVVKKTVRARVPQLRTERTISAEIALAIDPSMGWHPRTFPQYWKTEGHTRGARACRKLEYAANESATNEYYTDNHEWESLASNDEWGYIVGPTYLRRAVRPRRGTAMAETAVEE